MSDLISREALKKKIQGVVENEMPIDKKWALGLRYALKLIDDAPTVEITDYDTGYQDGLEDGLNDILPQGTNAKLFKQIFGLYATELWSMSESQFLEWLNSEYDCKEADNDNK